MKKIKKQLEITAGATSLAALLAAVPAANPLLMFIDVWSILGLVLIVIGLIRFLSHGGYFDFLSFSAHQTKVLFSKKESASGHRTDYVEYRSEKQRQRTDSPNWILTSGLLVTGINIVLTVLYGML